MEKMYPILTRRFVLLTFLCLNLITIKVSSFALPGKYEIIMDNNNYLFAIKNQGFYNDTQIQLKVSCSSTTKSVKIGWLLRLSECLDEFYLKSNELPKDIFEQIYYTPNLVYNVDYKEVRFQKLPLQTYECDEDSMMIDIYTDIVPAIITQKTNVRYPNVSKNPLSDNENRIAKQIKKRDTNVKKNGTESQKDQQNTQKGESKALTPESTTKITKVNHNHQEYESVTKTWQDGIYLFILITQPDNPKEYSLDVTVSFKHKNGYISGNDWPLLPFYGVMCGIYIVFALIWMTCSCCYWRDLLRIQLWIGGVIILGLMEKAAYLAEYEEINRHGFTVKVAMIVAEVISCLKRSLARMLVIIVSLGFGIVKPRLGPTMQKVVGVGAVYFILAVIDGVFRIIERKEDTDNKGVLAGIPLVIMDVSICYWIMSNLQQTMRTLRLRRNIPKLTLYRHFTNTLIFCVIASILFMIWSLKRHRFVNCLKDWKEMWLDDGFWHMLFSLILLVIIILWRPSNNGQRFAFTPLLDNDEDEDDEGQENEVFDSIKMRSKPGDTINPQLTKAEAIQLNQKTSIEDDLKWVEENVPSTISETALPGLVDSDEEIMTTRFEISKMD